MKSLKYLTFFFVFISLIVLIFFYFIYSRYNLDKIINKIELENNIDIELIHKPKWSLLPKIELNFNGNIKDNLNQFRSDNISFSFIKPYNISPINFNIITNSFYIKALKAKFIKIYGKYNIINQKIILENFQGIIGNGNFDTEGKISLSNNKEIELRGNFNNLYLNQLLRQLKFADWQRIEIRLSSENYILSSKLGNKQIFLEKLKGKIPVNGSVYFITSEEEKFGISFIQLLVEKILPDYTNVSKSISRIINNFSDEPVIFNGILDINNGKIYTSDLSLVNNNNIINIEGNYNIINDNFDTKLFFIESEKLIIEASIKGKLNNPSIKIINDSQVIDNDIKKIFQGGINNIIDKILNLNE